MAFVEVRLRNGSKVRVPKDIQVDALRNFRSAPRNRFLDIRQRKAWSEYIE
ncbi:hypothetical protein BgiBS90_027308, partial [Biomphalaria glabrata]